MVSLDGSYGFFCSFQFSWCLSTIIFFKDKLIGKYTTVAGCNYLAVPARLFERAGRCIRDINSQKAHLIPSSRYHGLELIWKLKIICFAANQFPPTLTHKGRQF